MKNLFKSINVTTNKNEAPVNCESISCLTWEGQEDCSLIHELLEEMGVSNDWEMFHEGVDVIENELNSMFVDETVYFWVD